MKNFINKLRYVKVKDFLAIIKLILAIPIAIIYKIVLKLKKRDIWVICEDEYEARDNGYWLYKYIKEIHPDQIVYYAINKKSTDFKKVMKLGNIIQYGSINHWVKYMVASKNISSHKGGKPNAAICYFMEVFGLWKNTRVFLQHGITINNANWLSYSETKMRLFVCGAYPEYEYVKKNLGYPENYVQYLGFCRFDQLHNVKVNYKEIVFMPTWRNWIAQPTKKSYQFDDVRDFTKTEYYTKCNELINNTELIDFLEKQNLKLYFYPHRNMQPYLNLFKTKSKNIILASRDEYDVQELLKRSATMITDYSSVSMDFGYMKKPLIYYQFDIEKFRKGHLNEGYFSYEEDGFGKVCYDINSVVQELKRLFENNFQMDSQYLNNHMKFFKLYDNKNCERNYRAIKNL